MGLLGILGERFGVPPHLLAEATLAEIEFDWEALTEGRELLRRTAPPKGPGRLPASRRRK